MMHWPKISVVIPNLNCADFLERTIRSVLKQSYPNLELIMVDGGSTDGSLEIIERYRDHFAHVVIGPDTGQANAVNKGFAKSTGDVMGWINSDDMLMPGGLQRVGRIFAQYKDVSWIVGNATVIEEDDKIRMSPAPRPHSAARFLAGDYQWLQQESCYWRRDLWEKTGGMLDESLRLAVDGELWMRFLQYAELTPVKAKIGSFRFRAGQRSADMDAYHREMLTAIERHREGLSSAVKTPQDALFKSLLEVRSRKEAEAMFPGIVAEDPKPLTRARMAFHGIKTRLMG